jgi:hypothetical protein
MTENRSAHLTSGWLTHAVAASCVAAPLALLNVPAAVPAVAASQERGVVELAALLAAPDPEPLRIEENVRSWSLFPPEGAAGRTLATALASCSFANRSDAQRIDLARRVYAITNGSSVSAPELAATVAAFREAAGAALCSAQSRDDIDRLLRVEARRDPRPRADWW